jgi:hypothetical protein
MDGYTPAYIIGLLALVALLFVLGVVVWVPLALVAFVVLAIGLAYPFYARRRRQRRPTYGATRPEPGEPIRRH